MANLGQSFNAQDLPQSEQNYDPIPAGWYDVTINSAELRNTKAGNGQFIAVRYDVVGPSHQGRVVWGNINIRNPNPKAEEIGHQQLGELMRAIGLTRVEDTDQLVGGACQIKVSVSQSEQYGASNEVKGFKANGSAAPAAPANKAAAPAAGTPPWKK